MHYLFTKTRIRESWRSVVYMRQLTLISDIFHDFYMHHINVIDFSGSRHFPSSGPQASKHFLQTSRESVWAPSEDNPDYIVLCGCDMIKDCHDQKHNNQSLWQGTFKWFWSSLTLILTCQYEDQRREDWLLLNTHQELSRWVLKRDWGSLTVWEKKLLCSLVEWQ